METPSELKNWEEIDRLLSSELEANRQRGTGKALQNMTVGIVNTQFTIQGLRSTIGAVRDKIDELNTNITASNESSTKLTKALNTITLAGAIIAGLGVLTAVVSLIFEIYKYTHGVK
jgi:hypothetical protein